jgi:hypothetical protein
MADYILRIENNEKANLIKDLLKDVGFIEKMPNQFIEKKEKKKGLSKLS